MKAQKKKFPIDYYKNQIGELKFADLIQKDELLKNAIAAIDADIESHSAKELFIQDNLMSIKSQYPNSPFIHLVNLTGSEMIKLRGYASYIRYPMITVNELVQLVYDEDYFKNGNIHPRRIGQRFEKLSENERYDLVVYWLLMGAGDAAVEHHLTTRLNQIPKGNDTIQNNDSTNKSYKLTQLLKLYYEKGCNPLKKQQVLKLAQELGTNENTMVNRWIKLKNDEYRHNGKKINIKEFIKAYESLLPIFEKGNPKAHAAVKNHYFQLKETYPDLIE